MELKVVNRDLLRDKGKCIAQRRYEKLFKYLFIAFI